MQRRDAILVLIGLTAGSCRQARATVPKGAVVLDGSAVGELLAQCSRASPERGEATWRPTPEDIVAAEAVIARTIATDPRADRIARFPLAHWWRQYVGIVRAGRRYIYGNFLPQDPYLGKTWRTSPVVVCDGGNEFFGVEYDVAAKTISDLGFNGYA